MEHWICQTCGTQFPQSQAPPSGCPICQDERQYIGHDGQQWTTMAQLRAAGFHNIFKEHEPGLLGIGTEPKFAIGQRALLVQTSKGNQKHLTCRICVHFHRQNKYPTEYLNY
ncbi:MAG TPA: hypothetical protein VFA09_15475 [Ktedonobacteraceae bacterium]|nr:hypothetical protein [Ktedonobacteraceae bacterium]